MKRIVRLTFTVLLILVLVLSLSACKKTPELSIANLGGSGTSESPYTLSVENGKSASFTPTISLEGFAFAVTAESGATNTEFAIKDGVVTVTGKSVGDTLLKVTVADTEVAAYVKVTVTGIPLTAINFVEMEEGEGTLASPLLASLHAGKTLTTPYTLAPTNADIKTVVWAVGTIANGVFTESSRGITAASNEGNNALTITAAADATVNETVIRATAGSANVYIKLTDISSYTAWDRAALINDWVLTNCAYDVEDEDNLAMPANGVITNKFNVTATTSAFGIRAKSSESLQVKINGTAVSALPFGMGDTTDGYVTLVYDLTAHVGNTVAISIANGGEGALQIKGAACYTMNKTVSTRTTWNKDEIISDWRIETAPDYRTGVGEGFDLNTFDGGAIEYIYNYFTVTTDTARISIKVRRFGQDNGAIGKAMLTVNGTKLTAMGFDSEYAEILDTDGKSSYLVYDLSEYVGQTVCVTFGQYAKNNGHLVIQEIKLDTFDKTASTVTNWDGRDAIAEDWDWTYAPGHTEREGVGEGFDLNTNDGSAREVIYNYVTITANSAKMEVKVRRFGQDSGNSNACLVFVNGKLMTPMGYVNGKIEIKDLDRVQYQLVYDLTEYVGETVQIVIAQPVPSCGHFVITGIFTSAWDAAVASTLTSWDKEAVKSDWNYEYASQFRDINEGFDLNTNDDDANELIYNYFAITENNCIFTMKVRRFNQDNGVANAVGVFVDGIGIIAAEQTEIYAPIADTDGVETILVYDLSAYIGKTVRIVIIQPVPKCGHLVIMNMTLTAPEE